MDRYGHLDMKNLAIELRKDGLDDFSDLLEKNPDFISEIAHKIFGDSNDLGIMPSMEIHGVPLTTDDSFPFDHNACLQKCSGECCKHKNYLMITLADIYNIISSHGAKYFGIKTTRDLFEGNPPLLELFYLEEYQLYFPYIRYLPVGSVDMTTRPEDAHDSICPFLQPIETVYQYYDMEVPSGTCSAAMGCMLMNNKPLVCRSSPLGMMTGLKTGKISYEYLPPARECPACESDKQVFVSDYMTSIQLPHEKEQQRKFHRILMENQKPSQQNMNKEKLHAITKDIYNIDGILDRYNLNVEHRPNLDTLIRIFFKAVQGDFSVYSDFIASLEKMGSKKITKIDNREN